MIGIGVVGYGYWGPNLVRNFSITEGTRMVGVADVRPERLKLVQGRYPALLATRDVGELIDHPDVDIVVVATPVSSHFEIALKALRAGKHVLVEKPLGTTSEECERLMEESQRRGRILMVDHTFVYTGAVRKLKELVGDNILGDLYYYDSARVNLGLFQHDVNVIWDLAVHDLSILDFLFPFKPVAVSATGMRHISGRPENIAFLTLCYDFDFLAHIHVNWLAPIKLRRTLIGGSQKMILFDDVEPSEKIKVYDKGITAETEDKAHQIISLNYRMGDMWAPSLDPTEALRIEVNHLLECVNAGSQPRTDGAMGLRVVKILEAATRSLEQRGNPVEIKL